MYARSSLKDRSFTNEFLLSCARENPHVIVLDPHKHRVTKPKPNKYPVKTSPPPSKLVQGPQKQPIATGNQSLPSKHARSSSPPTLANRKSIRTELSSAVPPPSSKLSPPSAHWRSTNATIIRQRHEVGVSGNAVPLQLAARKEKTRRACVHQIHHTRCQVGENGSRAVFSEHSSRIPLMEDLNNPLISMDCFVFL
ncbi:uncharacterized protein LOC113462442 [Phoenix dactylifera]|uniref:Uncharacterized protein LOC113462442 n=1 Tax=Phoenix dactylifera TaxID=42345 RepID=A0A8B8J1L0_PHODC|nr:uncharacterized protein LOC113462442 [Phoenix dactylifera]